MVASLTSLVPAAHTGWGMHGDSWDGWGVMMMFGMILFWAAIIVLVVWLVREVADRRAPDRKKPLDILQHRLAQGEISVDEFDQLREKLTGAN